MHWGDRERPIHRNLGDDGDRLVLADLRRSRLAAGFLIADGRSSTPSCRWAKPQADVEIEGSRRSASAFRRQQRRDTGRSSKLGVGLLSAMVLRSIG
jgi:hypothetical protein